MKDNAVRAKLLDNHGNAGQCADVLAVDHYIHIRYRQYCRQYRLQREIVRQGLMFEFIKTEWMSNV